MFINTYFIIIQNLYTFLGSPYNLERDPGWENNTRGDYSIQISLLYNKMFDSMVWQEINIIEELNMTIKRIKNIFYNGKIIIFVLSTTQNCCGELRKMYTKSHKVDK